MNKTTSFALTLSSILLLSGCAGTASDFECNATTSDTCMTIEQANDKAKRLEESSTVKPDVVALPRLAEGDFRTVSVQTLTPPPVPTVTQAPASRVTPRVGSLLTPHAPVQAVNPAIRTVTYQPLPATVPTREMIVDPRPLREGERTAGLWIAPYIDTQDVYHQPARVFFVVKPSAWGQPRVN